MAGNAGQQGQSPPPPAPPNPSAELDARLKALEERMTSQIEDVHAQYQGQVEHLQRENRELRERQERLGLTGAKESIPGAPRISKEDVQAFLSRRLPDSLFFTINAPGYKRCLHPGQRRTGEFREGIQSIGEPIFLEMRAFYGPGSDLRDPKPHRSDLLYLRIGSGNIADHPLVKVTMEDVKRFHLMDEASPEEIERYLLSHKSGMELSALIDSLRADEDLLRGNLMDGERYKLEIGTRYQMLWDQQALEARRQQRLEELNAPDAWKLMQSGGVRTPMQVNPKR